MPPADPWLDAAPTSPVGHPGITADTRPWNTVPSYTLPYEDRPPRRGRWLAAAAAVALPACLGGALLLNPFDDDDTPGRAGSTPARTVAGTAPRPSDSAQVSPASRPQAAGQQNPPASDQAAPTASDQPPPDASEVVYLVSSDSPGDVARVEYYDEDREIIRRGEVTLPWRYTFRMPGDRQPLVVIAQRSRGGTSPVTCSISLGGKVLTTAVARGRSAAPQCSA